MSWKYDAETGEIEPDEESELDVSLADFEVDEDAPDKGDVVVALIDAAILTIVEDMLGDADIDFEIDADVEPGLALSESGEGLVANLEEVLELDIDALDIPEEEIEEFIEEMGLVEVVRVFRESQVE